MRWQKTMTYCPVRQGSGGTLGGVCASPGHAHMRHPMALGERGEELPSTSVCGGSSPHVCRGGRNGISLQTKAVGCEEPFQRLRPPSHVLVLSASLLARRLHCQTKSFAALQQLASLLSTTSAHAHAGSCNTDGRESFAIFPRSRE